MIQRIFYFCFYLYVIFFSCDYTHGQDLLTLEEAVRISLKNNYDIILSANNLEIETNNRGLANAGILPSLTGDLTNNNSLQNSRQVRVSGEINEFTNAKTSNLNYGINFRWTIFDGLSMFARYNQLGEIRKLSDATMQQTILERVNDVYNFYYQLVQQQQQLSALKTTLEISGLRVETAKIRFQLGKAAKLEVLNSEVDYNTDTTNWLLLSQQYQNTQVYLNELLAREVTTKFRVTDSLRIQNNLQLDSLKNIAISQNPMLKMASIQTRIADLELKRIRGGRLPRLSVSSGYNFNQSQSALGFATQTSGRGLTYGVVASVNLFNGFLQNRLEDNAQILIKNAEVQQEKMNQNINAQLTAGYQTYTTNLSLVYLEENNVNKAEENLNITLEKFRLGSISTIEMRLAQVNLQNAVIRYSQAQYQAKLAELTLKMLVGKLDF